MIKSFRKSKRLSNSLGSSKQSISRVASGQLGHDAILRTPEKVIKALYDYTLQGPGELTFVKGDFFHLIPDNSGKHEANGWFEATNPATGQQGMVPITYFEVFNKSKHNSGQGGQNIEQSNQSNAKSLHVPAAKPHTQTLYALTLYAFKAERPDELDIVAGENLVICAHHDFEWFIAKPITRLGGPGLVPVLYVKFIDMKGADTSVISDDPVALINHFQIPTVEQWKDQTAKYEALSIPLGHISNNGPVVSSNSQFFQKEGTSSNRSSLGSTKTYVLDAAVESYHLEHGRYQYSVVSRLSNGKMRYLYRFYQDFYDLQVKLLELFPYEAGKIENSRRIIPSIPGPLINVNDSISKLRREKLDYYLRNLISLPPHISRSEEVLGLFEVLENGYDKEVNDPNKPVMRQSNSQQDRMTQYSNVQLQRNSLTPSLESPVRRSRSSSSTQLLVNQATMGESAETDRISKVKVKFYYEDDIFVLLLPVNLKLQDLKYKLMKRLSLDADASDRQVFLFLKNDYDDFMDTRGLAPEYLNKEQKDQLFLLVINDDERFQEILFDKCKVVILTD